MQCDPTLARDRTAIAGERTIAMTPELLRDVEALCDYASKPDLQFNLHWRECRKCKAIWTLPLPDGGSEPHEYHCPVLLAKRIREKLRDAYQCQHLKFTTTPLNPGIELGLTSYQPLGEPIKIRHIRQCDFCGKQLQDDGEWR